ncbi:hypothetical protein GCM10009639_64980 [Kitasatospora putterlickiae]|uniref:Uncharacterized protein n=1 Tax=Kitasatospora putterlickiae TaxID=221725 RepID=A0ABN1YIA4_9ACTN
MPPSAVPEQAKPTVAPARPGGAPRTAAVTRNADGPHRLQQPVGPGDSVRERKAPAEEGN